MCHCFSEFFGGKYFINNNTVTLIKYLGNFDREVVIPRKIDGKLVTKIAGSTFKLVSDVSSIYIPDSILEIGDNRLFVGREIALLGNCKHLKTITVDINNQHYSSNSGVLFDKNQTWMIFYPIGKPDADYTIPNTVVYISDEVFGSDMYKNKNLKHLNISSNVQKIDEGGFGGFGGFASNCKNLQTINVFENNPFYSSIDGVLFDKSKSTLIRCPMGKDGYYIVPYAVVKIEAFAFAGCEHIRGIFIPDCTKEIGLRAFSFLNESDLVIWGNSNSYACEYAKEHDLKFMDKNKNRFLFNRYFGGNK